MGRFAMHWASRRAAATAARSLLILAGAISSPSMADVHAFVDAEGIEHYANVPDERAAGVSGARLVSSLREGAGEGLRVKAPEIRGKASRFAERIRREAEEAGIDAALVHAVIAAESGYDPEAVSGAGAQGLMQLMPGTAKRYAVRDPFDPGESIRGGASYLRDLLDIFGGDVEIAVAACNAGESAVIRHGGKIPPYRETRAYVPKVMRLYRKYSEYH